MRAILKSFFWAVLAGLSTLAMPSASLAKPSDVVIILGNKTYRAADRVDAVAFAHNDMRGFRAFAKRVLQVPDENIIHLDHSTTQGDFIALFGPRSLARRGTRRRLSRAILRRIKDPAANIYVFYSGHALAQLDPITKQVQPYLLPFDARPSQILERGYPVLAIQQALEDVLQAKAPKGRAFLFIDGCFSGRFNDGKGNLMKDTSGSASAGDLITSIGGDSDIDRVSVFTAGRGDQAAYWDRTNRHGVMTDALLWGLFGAADRYGNRDGKVTASELDAWLKRRVAERMRVLHGDELQTPTFVGEREGVVVDLRPLGDRAPPRGSRVQAASMERQCIRLTGRPGVLLQDLERLKQRCVMCSTQCHARLDAMLTTRTQAQQTCQQELAFFRRYKHDVDRMRAFAAKATCPRVREQLGRRLASCLPGSGHTMRDCPDCAELVAIPAGRVQVADDYDRKTVNFARPFFLGKNEVSVGEYMKCVARGACRPPEWVRAGSRRADSRRYWRYVQETGPAPASVDDFPVVGVSHEDAQSYIRYLNGLTRNNARGRYMLPSEMQLFYAIMAKRPNQSRPWWAKGTGTARRSPVDKQAGVFDEQRLAKAARSTKRAHPWGLNNVLGNVREWAADCWVEDVLDILENGRPVRRRCSQLRTVTGGSRFDVRPRLGEGRRFSLQRFRTDRDRLTGFRVARAMVRTDAAACRR